MAIPNKISSTETYLVRHPALRMGKINRNCCFEGDDLETTNHFGLYLNHKLVGVISPFKKTNDGFLKKNQCQIRGMAVLKIKEK